MASTFLDLIYVLFWPLLLSAGAWAIAFDALGEPDKNSDVVESLFRPRGAKDSTLRAKAISAGSDSSATASSHPVFFRVRFRRPQLLARKLSMAKQRVAARKLWRADIRHSNRRSVARRQRQHERAGTLSP